MRRGADAAEARRRAEFLLARLSLPAAAVGAAARDLLRRRAAAGQHRPPLIADYPILLLDEPTASLDAANRDVVVELIRERRDAGAAIVGIFHDADVRDAVADRVLDVALPGAAAMSTEIDPDQRPHRHAPTPSSTAPSSSATAASPRSPTGRSHAPRARIDLDGDYLVPGLVELHTDNLEKHFAPRPGVNWPAVPAVLAHDTQIAAAGITTVFDSLSLGDVHGDTDRVQNRERMIEAICAASDRRMTRAEHRLHLRCEITADDAVEAVDTLDRPAAGRAGVDQRPHARASASSSIRRS